MVRILKSSFQQQFSVLPPYKNISLLRATRRPALSIDAREITRHLYRTVEISGNEASRFRRRHKSHRQRLEPKKRSILRLRRIQWNKSYDVPNAHRERERYRSGARGDESGGRLARWPNDRIWSLQVKALTAFPFPRFCSRFHPGQFRKRGKKTKGIAILVTALIKVSRQFLSLK